MTIPNPPVLDVQGDQSLVGGVYANGLGIWHTGHEFTLDFMVNAGQPQQVARPDGQHAVHYPQRIVTRVRIPPGVIFEVIKAMNENMTIYEQTFGPIRQPGTDSGPRSTS